MSLVSQEPLLFSATVLDNILYSRMDASMVEVGVGAYSTPAWTVAWWRWVWAHTHA